MYYNNKWLLWSFYSNRRIVLSINKRFYRKVPGWKIYNHPSVDPSSSSDTHRQSLLQQWFDPSAFTLFAFQSVGRWHGNLVRQAHRFDWQYTLRSLLVSNKQQNDDSLQLGISDTKLIPLIFIEWSENVDDWKDHIAAFGIREPVVGLSCLHDWQSLVDQLGLSSEWKTTGFQLLQRNDASWLFKTEHKIYYGFHDSNRSASESIQLPSIHSDGQSLAQLVAQAQSLESASNRTMSNMEQVASNLQLNALDSWYDFRELEYQQRLAFAVSETYKYIYIGRHTCVDDKRIGKRSTYFAPSTSNYFSLSERCVDTFKQKVDIRFGYFSSSHCRMGRKQWQHFRNDRMWSCTFSGW